MSVDSHRVLCTHSVHILLPCLVAKAQLYLRFMGQATPCFKHTLAQKTLLMFRPCLQSPSYIHPVHSANCWVFHYRIRQVNERKPLRFVYCFLPSCNYRRNFGGSRHCGRWHRSATQPEYTCCQVAAHRWASINVDRQHLPPLLHCRNHSTITSRKSRQTYSSHFTPSVSNMSPSPCPWGVRRHVRCPPHFQLLQSG